MSGKITEEQELWQEADQALVVARKAMIAGNLYQAEACADSAAESLKRIKLLRKRTLQEA